MTGGVSTFKQGKWGNPSPLKEPLKKCGIARTTARWRHGYFKVDDPTLTQNTTSHSSKLPLGFSLCVDLFTHY
jgi:hypothetical protein